MLKQVRSTFLLALIDSVAAPTAVAAEWQLVEDSSTVRFIGVQEGSAFRGRFQNFSAMIDFDPANPTELGVGVTNGPSVSSLFVFISISRIVQAFKWLMETP